VKLLSLVFHLLSILAVVSFLAAPMVTPSRAGGKENASLAAMSDMASMSDSMPCCPDEKPSLPDCQKSCPLAILCMAKCFPSVPAASVLIPARFAVAEVKMPGNDVWRDLLPEPPPPEPPRA